MASDWKHAYVIGSDGVRLAQAKSRESEDIAAEIEAGAMYQSLIINRCKD
jgi:hypothetical protein